MKSIYLLFALGLVLLVSGIFFVVRDTHVPAMMTNEVTAVRTPEESREQQQRTADLEVGLSSEPTQTTDMLVVVDRKEAQRYALNRATGEKVILAKGTPGLFVTAISPDGRWGATSVGGGSEPIHIGIVSLLDGTYTELFESGNNPDLTRRVMWASNSSAFVSACLQGELIGVCHVDVSSGIPRMTRQGGITNSFMTSAPERLLSVAISHDGRTAAWIEWRKYTREMRYVFVTVDATGNVERKEINIIVPVTTGVEYYDTLAYSSDGKSLYYDLFAKSNVANSVRFVFDIASESFTVEPLSIAPNGTYLAHEASGSGAYTKYIVLPSGESNVAKRLLYVGTADGVFVKVQTPTDVAFDANEAYWTRDERLILPIFDYEANTNKATEYEIHKQTGVLSEVCERWCEEWKLQPS